MSRGLGDVYKTPPSFELKCHQYMENKYSKYTDDILIQMMENGLDLDENMLSLIHI
nr:hypothetical protein [Elizabethkingia sp. ASV34]